MPSNKTRLIYLKYIHILRGLYYVPDHVTITKQTIVVIL